MTLETADNTDRGLAVGPKQSTFSVTRPIQSISGNVRVMYIMSLRFFIIIIFLECLITSIYKGEKSN